jgi:hypothetical protein
MLDLLVYPIIFFLIPIITGILSFVAFPLALLLDFIKSPMLIRILVSGLIRGSIAFALSYYVFVLFNKEFNLLGVTVLFIAMLLPAMKALNPLVNLKNKQSDGVSGSTKEVINLVEKEINDEKTMFTGEVLALILLSVIYFF